MSARSIPAVTDFGLEVMTSPYVGYANQRAASRRPCSVMAGGGLVVMGNGSVGMPSNSKPMQIDGEFTVSLGAGVRSGVMCSGGFHVPGLPR